MKESELIDQQKARRKRLKLVVVGLIAICSGGPVLLVGKLHYSNYRGAAVFAPFVVFAGSLALVGAFRLRKK